MITWHYIAYIGLIFFILLCGVWIFLRCQRQKAVLQSVASEFGKIVSMKAGISSFYVNFERDGTVYESSVISSNYGTAYILHFYLPQANEKFYIRQNSPIASLRTEVDESRFSQSVSVSGFPDNYLVLSPNPEFSKKLLLNKSILTEIITIDSAFSYPQISFDNGSFRIRLNSIGWDLQEKFRHLCRAAVSFRDGIRRLS